MCDRYTNNNNNYNMFTGMIFIHSNGPHAAAVSSRRGRSRIHRSSACTRRSDVVTCHFTCLAHGIVVEWEM